MTLRKISALLAAIALGAGLGVVVAASAEATGPTNVVFWAVPGEFGPEGPNANNAFDNRVQTFHSYGESASLDTEPRTTLECGVWYQVDKYTGNHPFGPGDTLAGTHQDGEYLVGGGAGNSWRFVYGGDCEVEVIEHCTGWVETITTDGIEVRTGWHHDASLQTCIDGESG